MIEDAWRIVGGKPLEGTVTPAGSKNCALPALAATLMLDGETRLHNIPRIADTETMMELLRSFGLQVEARAGGEVRVVNRGLATHVAPGELVQKMRASHYLLGPVISRMGKAELPLPGGCDIGDRPVGYIIEGLEALGARAACETNRISVEAARLRGAAVALNPAYRSPGATFNLLMAAATAEGRTVIENASFEPDVVSFCQMLNAAGARISGIGRDTLTVEGVAELRGVTHRVNSDRLEAGTFLVAAAATRGAVLVNDVATADLGAAADKLSEAGVRLEAQGGGLRATCPGRPRALSLVTEPFPGFPTDLQPMFTALLARAEGTSTITESIFDRRLQCIEQLNRMGAFARLTDGRSASIHGVAELHGARIEAHNIRDGAALVIAALAARGESTVSGRQFVARGYENFEGKLQSLGADIQQA
ncbi:MAG: UDP-N-acetylglucosamine 1-carboxyvinyltransferase [Armatimonadota bacterium]